MAISRTPAPRRNHFYAVLRDDADVPYQNSIRQAGAGGAGPKHIVTLFSEGLNGKGEGSSHQPEVSSGRDRIGFILVRQIARV